VLDLLLVNPGGIHGVYGDLGEDLVAREQPLWCRLLAGYLLDRGWSVEICDQDSQNLTVMNIALTAASKNARIVALVVAGHQPSASTQSMPMARQIAEAVRLPGLVTQDDELYRPVVVMLGNHPSALPTRTLLEEPVDYVIDGEGPVTLDVLLQGVKPEDVPGKELPGLVWRGTGHLVGTIIKNPLAPLLDLDEDLHGNAWHLLPSFSSYKAHSWQCLDDLSMRSPYAAIYTSLSCPMRCSFCMIQTMFHSHQHRRRSPARVVEEVKWLYDQGVRTYKVIDELFVLNREHVRAICQGIVDLGIGDDINLWAYSRTDSFHVEDLPLMRRAGIKWLALGIESGAHAVRDAARKNLRHDENNDPIVSAVRAIQAADINVIGNYIFGLQNDTHETMRSTLDLALELNTEFANFYSCMAYPGSALYDEVLRDRSQDLPSSWAAYSQHNRFCHPLRNDNLNAAEVLAFRDVAFREYYTNANYQAMIRRRFGYMAVEHISKMLEYRLERDLLKEPA
jgi:anaerobic magnesium-protoporphyrin IX monomethyl ester cyclase